MSVLHACHGAQHICTRRFDCHNGDCDPAHELFDAGPAALDAMARARVATMRLRKQRQTELLALAGCQSRAATLLESKPEAPAAETLQVCSVVVCPFSICSEPFVKNPLSGC